MTLNIMSLNVRGIRNDVKRRSIFEFYRKRCDILCLQETHSTVEDEKLWTNEWGGKCIFSHGTSNSRGVVICVKRDCKWDIKCATSDGDGRFATCMASYDTQNIALATIYGPNDDSPEFFTEKIEKTHMISDKMVIIGDFNAVVNNDKDRNNSLNRNKNASERIRSLMETCVISDVWRLHNPDTKRFSWYRKINDAKHTKAIQASRIDYALVSSGMCDEVHNTFYMNGLHSDHSAFFVGFKFGQYSRGSSFWKMNTSLLSDANFVQELNVAIEDSRAANKCLSSIDKWEMLKRDVKNAASKYSRRAAAEDGVAISQLVEHISEMEDRVTDLSEDEIQILEKSKIDLEELQFKKVKGVMFRSKAKWCMEAEKGTRYFYNLERKRANAKTCHALLNNKGQTISDEQQVLKLQENYYRDLYTADPQISFKLEKNIEGEVPSDHIAAQNSPFTEDEIKEAICGLKNNSCPGSDGLPSEFYKVFWTKVKQDIMNMIEESYGEMKLHSSARRGILNLIPKKDKDTRVLKNLRPITLLNTDYKIIEKAIANRMLSAMDIIISKDQTGFLPGRRISTNIRKILDIISCGEETPEEIDGFIMSCNYMKCFDRIEFKAVDKALEFFSFSTYIRQWIRLLYSNFTVRVQNNGHFSNNIPINRSVHQGAPASNVLFLCVAELIANSLRQGGQVKGLYVKEIILVLSQYADDMDVILHNCQKNMDLVMKKMNEFSESTGFCLSYEKTSMYRVGAMHTSKAELYTGKEIAWNRTSINVLGVEIVRDVNDLIITNYKGVIQKAKATLSTWENRSLSLFGKVEIVNSLVGSLFVYKLTAIPNMTPMMIKELNTAINKFIWNGHKPKIAIETLQKKKSDGGANLVNFEIKQEALKASWVKSILEGNYPAEIVYNILHPHLKENIWACNLSSEDVDMVINICPQHIFWKEVLKAWCKYHYRKQDETLDHDQILWLNTDIRIRGSPVWWPNAYKRGLLTIGQLFQESRFKSDEELRDEYGLSILEINSLKVSIPVSTKEIFKSNSDLVLRDPKFYEYMDQLKTTKLVYKELQRNCSTDILPNLAQKWHTEICDPECCESQLDCVSNLREAFNRINCHSPVSKHRSFQYKLLHRAIVTNIQLERWKIKDSKMCTFCGEQEETIKHLMYTCRYVILIWDGVVEYINNTGGHVNRELVTYRSIVLNSVHPNPSSMINGVCNITKQYIYRKRCAQSTPSVQELKQNIRQMRNIEKYYAVKNNNLTTYAKRWYEPEAIVEHGMQIDRALASE